jgi:hypothetical protein
MTTRRLAASNPGEASGSTVPDVSLCRSCRKLVKTAATCAACGALLLPLSRPVEPQYAAAHPGTSVVAFPYSDQGESPHDPLPEPSGPPPTPVLAVSTTPTMGTTLTTGRADIPRRRYNGGAVSTF